MRERGNDERGHQCAAASQEALKPERQQAELPGLPREVLALLVLDSSSVGPISGIKP